MFLFPRDQRLRRFGNPIGMLYHRPDLGHGEAVFPQHGNAVQRLDVRLRKVKAASSEIILRAGRRDKIFIDIIPNRSVGQSGRLANSFYFHAITSFKGILHFYAGWKSSIISKKV